MLVDGQLDLLLGEALDNQYDIGICAMILNESGKTLLLKRAVSDTSASAWEMPGGSVDPGENLTDALLREVGEETGLTPTSSPTYVGCFDFHNIEKGLVKRKFCFKVVCHGEVALSQAHSEHAFMGSDDVSSLSASKTSGDYIFQDHKEIILKS